MRKKTMALAPLIVLFGMSCSGGAPDAGCGTLTLEENGSSMEINHAMAIHYKDRDMYLVEFYDKDPAQAGYTCDEFVKLQTEGGSNPEGLRMFRVTTSGDDVTMFAERGNHLRKNVGKVTSKSSSGVAFCMDPVSAEETSGVNSSWNVEVKGGGVGAKVCSTL